MSLPSLERCDSGYLGTQRYTDFQDMIVDMRRAVRELGPKCSLLCADDPISCHFGWIISAKEDGQEEKAYLFQISIAAIRATAPDAVWNANKTHAGKANFCKVLLRTLGGPSAPDTVWERL